MLFSYMRILSRRVCMCQFLQSVRVTRLGKKGHQEVACVSSNVEYIIEVTTQQRRIEWTEQSCSEDRNMETNLVSFNLEESKEVLPIVYGSVEI